MPFWEVESEPMEPEEVKSNGGNQPQDPVKGLPMRVAVSMDFIRECNEMMGLRGFPGISGTEVVEQELAPCQESVFRLACQTVGEYLSEGLRCPRENST